MSAARPAGSLRTAGREKRACGDESLGIPNAERSAVRFRMEPRAQWRAFQRIEAAGLELVGIYHSHPQRSRPSFANGYRRNTCTRWRRSSGFERTESGGRVALKSSTEKRLRSPLNFVNLSDVPPFCVLLLLNEWIIRDRLSVFDIW